MSTTISDPGDVLLVRVPYTDLGGEKKRPAVILSTPGYHARYGDLIIVPLTSIPQADAKLKIKQWRQAGLIKPSWAKTILSTISTKLVVKRLGRLSSGDVSAVRHAIRSSIDNRWLA